SILYAIVDGTCEDELINFLSESDPPATCLYAEPLQPDIISLAPYLIQVTEEVRNWLDGRESDWGIYLYSKANLRNIRHHLRKYLQVSIPEQVKPVYFRFYDPRNIWLVCDVLSDWQLHQFLGPIEKIMCVHKNEVITKDFSHRRQQFPQKIIQYRKMLRFTEEQLTIVNQIFQQRYIISLTKYMCFWASNNKSINYVEFSESLFYYLQKLNITDDRTIKALAKFFIEKGYRSIQEI